MCPLKRVKSRDSHPLEAPSFAWRTENGFQHHHRRPHDHAGCDSRYPEWAHFLAAFLRDPPPSARLGSIRPPAECVRQFAEPQLFPVRFDVRKILPIYPRCTLLGFAPTIRITEHICPIHLVVQQVKPIVRLSLSFRL